MRGMIKWKPFNTLLTSESIKEIQEEKYKIETPEIMEDKIIEINEILISSINNDLNIEINYWNLGMLKKVNGKIQKINTNEKYILINKTRIYFKYIINVKTI